MAGRLLLTEPTTTSRLLLAALLERLGASVESVGSGLEAMAALGRSTFDLMILDAAMAGPGGGSLAGCVRRSGFGRDRLVLIGLSGPLAPEERAALQEEGLDDCLERPVDGERLKVVVGAWLAGRARATIPDAPATVAAGALMAGTFDPAALQELASMLRPAAVAGIIDTFCNEARQREADIISAGAADDLATVARQAHPLKSSAAGVGAVAVSELARALEQAGKAGDAEVVSSLCGDLSRVVAEACAALQSWHQARVSRPTA